MKHFYLMHGMMGECPEGDESGAYVSAIDAKSEITDLQRQLADLTKLYEDVRYEHAHEKSRAEQVEIQLAETNQALAIHLAVAEDDPILTTPLEKQMYDLREKLEKAEAWEKLAGIDLATAQAQPTGLREAVRELISEWHKSSLSDHKIGKAIANVEAALAEGRKDKP